MILCNLSIDDGSLPTCLEEWKKFRAGRIGLQPIIAPKQFVYTLLSVTDTTRHDEGYYEMQNLEDEHFTIDIPKFILSAPSSVTGVYKAKLH